MSQYIYNGVALQYVKTTHYEISTERDQSGTDVVWYKYLIRVRGFVTLSSLGIGPDSAQALQFLKNSLESPRRGLYYTQGSTVVLQIGYQGNVGSNPGVLSALDAKLGPEPLPTVVHEVSSGTFAIETGVIVRRVECLTETDQNGNPCPPSPIVSLRWTQTESFDENWYSHLTTEGTLIVRSDLLFAADTFRAQCTPPILPDYRRTRAKYQQAPDGLSITFAFEDVEEDRLPPFPATQASGTYTVISPRPGVSRMGNVQIRLEGQKGTSRMWLLVKAFNMAYSKLRADNFLSKTTPIVWGTFQENLFRPVVEVSMQAMMSPISKPKGFAAALTGAFNQVQIGGIRARLTRPQVPQVMPSVGLTTYGLNDNRDGIAPPLRKRIAALVAAAFGDPCACAVAAGQGLITELVSDNFLPVQAGPGAGANPNIGNPGIMELRNKQGAGGVGDNAMGPEWEYTIGPIQAGSQSNIDDTAPYDHYSIEAKYRWHSGLAAMPGTGVGSAGNQAQAIRFHGGLMVLDVVWVCGRTGDQPVLPAYQSQDPNLTAMDGDIVAKDLQFSADGATVTYMIAGWYQYMATDPTKVSITAPIPPFLDQTVAKQVAPLAAAAYSNMPLFSFVGATGPNPFVLPTPSTNAATNTQWADQQANSAGQVLALSETTNPTSSSSAAGSPFGTLGAGGGLFTGRGSVVGAGPAIGA